MNGVYRYISNSNTYHSAGTVADLAVDWPNEFDGRRMGPDWEPLPIRWWESENGGDFPHFESHLPLVSEAAWRLLEPLIGESVERLDVVVDGHPTGWYLLNVVAVLDCLDKERSVMDVFHPGGIVLDIEKHVFEPSAIVGHPIFRIKGYEVGGVYVSEAFREIVEKGGFEGLIWEDLP